MSPSPLLQMANISKSFGSNQVLTDINLDLYEGEVIALLGENGAGKSTLIKILGGIYKANRGEIFINGEKKDIRNAGVAGENGIRIIHQEIVLVPDRSIADNVFLGREYVTKTGLIDKKRMEYETQKLLDDFGINIGADQNVRNLPIGMQQLVEIIKAISAEAKIVVMDEPTSSLSQSETQKLFEIIALLKKRNIGIIYISHRLEELFEVTDRIIVLRDGNIVAVTNTKDAKREELITQMVGRTLSSYYTRNPHEVGEVALEVKNLCHEKFFTDINFEAHYGEVVGFAGLVGARRTELMKTVFGAIKKKSGEILLDGKKIEIERPSDAIKAGIVYVSEDRKLEGLVLTSDVKFNMGLVCLRNFVNNLKVDNKAWDAMIDEYTKKFSIRLNSHVQITNDLSGGNQQKVVLSKWLAEKPKVIIFDEPTRGIDVGAKADIYSIIDHLVGEGACVIMISSDLLELINTCNRCYVMCEGRITGVLQETEFSQETMMHMATAVQH